MSVTVKRCVRLAIALSAMPLVLPAQAQDAAADDTLLEEIVVTAQKREESLRDVPLSVEAVSGEKLVEAGILRLDDLKAYVPNLQMTETGIANNIYIRGIGSGLNQGFEQSVSTYADGIYRGRGHQSRMPFLDLQRIEVLRGPQPVLFGKNAVAGAVNLVAAHPGDEFEGKLRASHDLENDDTVGNLVLSGPLSVPSARARLAVHYRDAAGYVHNNTLNRDEPQRSEFAGRLTLDFDINDATTLSWRTEAGLYKSTGRQIEIFGETPITAGPLTGLRYSQIVAGPVPAFPQGQNASAANNVIDFQRSSNGDHSKLSNFESAATLNISFDNGLTLTSVSGVSTYKLNERCDCDFVGATVFNAGITERYQQFSQELRLTSNTEGMFSWIGGAFFQRYLLDETDYLFVPSNSLVVPVLAQSFAGNPALGGTPQSRAALANFFANAVNPRVFRQNSDLYSAFLQGTWSFTDALKMSAGGRFSKEDKIGDRTTTLTTGFGGANLPAGVLPLFASALGIIPHTVSGTRSEDSFSPLVNFQLNVTPESMLYLSWSQGTKSGGFDARSNRPLTASGTFEFEDEKATTYELGLKAGLGGVAEINANIFYTDYKDLQTSAFDGAIGFNVGNGSAKVQGAEVEGRWRVARGFTLSGSAAYLDFEWQNYNGQCYFGRPADAGLNCNYAGFTNQLAPKFSGVLGADYNWSVGSNLKMRAGADMTFMSKFLQSLTLDPATTQKAYSKFNARLALGNAGNNWEVALIGRNLTDKTTVSYAGDTPLSARLFRARSYYGFVDMPRSIALEASLNF